MIKIIEEPDIYITESQRRRYAGEYRNLCSMHTSPPSFDEFVRGKQARANLPPKSKGERVRDEWKMHELRNANDHVLRLL